MPIPYLEREPVAALRGVVQRMWWLEVDSRERFERIVPIPAIHVIVNLSPEPYRVLACGRHAVGEIFPGAFVSGLQVEYLLNENPKRLRHVGAALHPWAARAVGVDPAAITGRVVDAAELLPGLASAAEPSEPAAHLDALEAALVGALDPEWSPDRRVVAAVGQILGNPWIRVTDLADSVGMSAKGFAQAFRRGCGVTPKRFAEVARHQAFLAALPADGELPRWSELIADHGYFDQPHFIREFRRFTGMSPGEYVEHRRRFGHGNPSFLELDEALVRAALDGDISTSGRGH